MALDALQRNWQVFQVEVEAHWKVATAATLVAGAVYLIWGKVAMILYAGAVIFSYINFGPTIRVLNQFDLKGVTLAAAAFVAPFFGGIPAYLAGALVAMSLLAHEWQQYQIRADLEQNNQAFTLQVVDWEAQVAVLGQLLKTCQDRNAQIVGVQPEMVDRARSAQELQIELGQKFTQLNERVQAFRSLFAGLQAQGIDKEMLALGQLREEVVRLQGMETGLREQIVGLESRLKGLADRDAAVNDRVEVVVSNLQQQADRLREVVDDGNV